MLSDKDYGVISFSAITDAMAKITVHAHVRQHNDELLRLLEESIIHCDEKADQALLEAWRDYILQEAKEAR
jgi:hypothetical protein